ncbi:MAG: tRNA (adenosine(37)-N6)-dimethylallyltransferase MiaA, partial [Thermodesulfobacteriota bacterium]
MISNHDKKPKLIVILGPTAVGKTKLGIDIAKKIGASVISADSVQIYKHLDIGTAKPTPKERKEVEHYMIDLFELYEECNAGIYREIAISKIDQLLKQDKKIVIVGGTFLYVKVLLSGLLENIRADVNFRAELKKLRNKKGTINLHKRLTLIDPDSSKRIHANDYVRIERALEVYHLTGKTISEHQKNHAFHDRRFDVLKIGIGAEREKLRSQIDKRVDRMITDGLVDEVEMLREKGFSSDLKPMQSIGYKQINQY